MFIMCQLHWCVLSKNYWLYSANDCLWVTSHHNCFVVQQREGSFLLCEKCDAADRGMFDTGESLFFTLNAY